jgi:hydroxymethylpyrimidine/phosphomethylpyrimidine kinase
MIIYKALTIAGSDSGAGAGLQADLKTFAALRVYGTSVVTAVTAQNTVGVTAIREMPPRLVSSQIDAVMEDIGAQAAKTGMLANAGIIRAVAKKMAQYRVTNLVVDPVMVAKGGDVLLRRDAIDTLRSDLMPLAAVVTPNLPEACELAGIEGASLRQIREMAHRIIDLGPRSVVIKGGHRRGPANDLFYDGSAFHELPAARIPTKNTHGTGCTYSAAITAYLARGKTIEEAVSGAKRFITAAIQHAFSIGSGHGPVHHFHREWPTGC